MFMNKTASGRGTQFLERQGLLFLTSQLAGKYQLHCWEKYSHQGRGGYAGAQSAGDSVEQMAVLVLLGTGFPECSREGF